MKKTVKTIAATIDGIIFILLTGIIALNIRIPDSYSVAKDRIYSFLAEKGIDEAVSFSSDINEYSYVVKLMGKIPVKEVNIDVTERQEVYVSGAPFGIKMFTDGLMIVGMSDISSEGQRINPAKEAGLEVGDIITAIADTAIDSPSALTAALSSNYKAGESAELTVIRQQKELKLTVTFDEKNSETEANNQIQQETQQPQQIPGGYNGGSGNNFYYQWPFGNFFGW